MKTSTTFRFSSAVGLIFALSLGAPLGASASESPYDTPEVRKFYNDYGVDGATQDRLIASMESGDLNDAMKKGEEPVSSIVSVRGGFTETVFTYADGSIGVTALENPTPAADHGVTTRGVSGCTVHSGAGWASSTNCLVSHTAAYASLSFRANYQQTTSGASVSNPNSGKINTTFGSVSNQTLKVIRASSTSSQPAVATLHGYWTSGSISEDLYLSLRVDKGGAWTTTY